MAHHTRARNGFVWTAALSAVAWATVAIGQVADPANTPPPTDPPAVVAPAPTPPAVVEIQRDLDQKQYAAAIRLASKLLTQHADVAYSRFQVLMLKGDAQLGAHAIPAARTTYHDAIKETRDPHERALATWTVELLKQAKGTTYVPHVAGPGAAGNGPIDLIDATNRKAAFAALLDDQLSILAPQIKQASGTPSLPQILPVVKQVQSLAELDEIASGTDARTAAAAGTLLEHARNLMSNALKGMWTRTSDIYSAATQTVTSNGGTVLVNGQAVPQTVTSQNGLTGSDASELRRMIDDCAKIAEAAAVFAPLSNGAADKDWGAILNDATRVAGRARDVLNANYSTATASTQIPNDGTNNGVGLNGAVGLNGNIYYPPGGNGVYNGVFPTNGGTPPRAQQQAGNGNTPVVTTPPASTDNNGGSGSNNGGAIQAPVPTPRSGGASPSPSAGHRSHGGPSQDPTHTN